MYSDMTWYMNQNEALKIRKIANAAVTGGAEQVQRCNYECVFMTSRTILATQKTPQHPARRCASRDSTKECVICEWLELFSEVYVVKFSLYSKFVWVIWTLYRRGKLLEHFILIAVALVLNILLSWAFVTSLNCSAMCRRPWWFECCFCRSSWIHCWLLLAVLSDYFGQLVTSTFLLCKFWGLPRSTPVRPVSNVVLRRYKTATEFRFPRTAGGFPA